MIEAYLTNTVTLYKRLDINKFGEPVYDNGNVIHCRIERKAKLVRKPDGETTYSESHIITNAVVAVGDKIEGRVVIGVDEISGLDGVVEGRSAYL